MELYRDMLCKILESEEFEILLPKWKMNVEEMIEMKCYQALNEIKKMHTKKKVLWQEEDKKHYLNLILQLKTLPIDALNAKDQTFIQHIYKNSNGYLH